MQIPRSTPAQEAPARAPTHAPSCFMFTPAKDAFFFFFIRHCSVLIFVIPPFVCFIRPLLPAPFFMSVPVRYCLEEKCREANAIVGLPLGSPEAINTTEENEMFFLWTITHTLFTVWLKSRRAHFSNKSRLA